MNPNELILPALWAALRCSDPAGTLLGEIIPGIFSVSDEPGVGGTSPRDGLFQELSFTAKHGFSSDVLIFLRNLADRDERYRNFVFSLFSHIDHPVCLEFGIRRMAQAAADPVEPGKGSMTFVWEHPWRLGALFEAPPMPLDCVEWLKRCWQSSNPDWLRSYAFKLWVRFSGDALWATELPADSDESFSERAKRGDQRVAEKLLCKTALDSRWFSFIRHLWADSFEPALDMALKVGNYCAIRALRDVPTEVAERLITGNRNVISDKPSAIAAGLYVGKDTTIALATAALQADTDARSKFRDIGDYFGFNYHGYSDRITIRHLEVLRPFVNLLDDHDLAHISEFCCATGYRDWAQENLLTVCRLRMSESSNSVLSHRVRRLFPTDEELVSDLDQIVSGNQRQIRYSVERWADGFAERSDDPERMVRMLIDWLGSAPPVVKFRVAALAIRHQGSRLTLGVLSRFTASPQWPEMEEYFRDAEYCVMRRSLL